MYDQTVVSRVMDGDLEAFSRMYNDCAPAVYRRAFALTNDPIAARTVVRNTFRDIRKYAKELVQPSDFDEWVFRLVNLHVEQLKIEQNKLWDEPNLEGVWEELENEEGAPSAVLPTKQPAPQTKEELPEKKKKPAAKTKKKSSPQKEIEVEASSEEDWEPILFPPEEGAGQGAAISAVENAYSTPAGLEYTSQADADSIGPDTERNTIPPLETDKPSSKGKKVRKVRYEAAHVKPDVHFSVEHVPYDYIPYEESSQEAYDRISLEDSPRAVYEHVPYQRTQDDPKEGHSYERIPYSSTVSSYQPDSAQGVVPPLQADMRKDAPPPPDDITTMQPLLQKKDGEAEQAAALRVIPHEKTAAQSETSSAPPTPNDQPPQKGEDWSLSEEMAKDDGALEAERAAAADAEWANIDPLRLNIDEILEQIVAEVDQAVSQDDAAQKDSATPSAAAPASEETTAVPVETAATAAEPAEAKEAPVAPPASEKAAANAVNPPATDKAETPPPPTAEENSSKSTTDAGEEKQPTELIPTELSPVEGGSGRGKKLLAGAGFFIGIVVLLVGVIFLGFYLKWW